MLLYRCCKLAINASTPSAFAHGKHGGIQSRYLNLLHPQLASMSTVDAAEKNEGPTLRQDALSMFKKAIDSVLPQYMVKKALQVDNDQLTVENRTYKLHNNVHILAFGKAISGMVRAAEDVLGPHVQGGVGCTTLGILEGLKKEGKLDLLPSESSKVKIHEGSPNNSPDEAAHAAAMKIYDLAEKLGPDDIALVLITGGGSALLPTPIPPITVEELETVTNLLFSQACEITQVNTVRKNLELLKGGGLAKVAAPAQVISLILSDIINDPLEFISSGPTTPDYSSPEECIDLFNKYHIIDKVPASVMTVLEEKNTNYSEMRIRSMLRLSSSAAGEEEDEIKAFDRLRACINAQNVVVGNNVKAAEAAEAHAKELGYVVCTISTSVNGDSKDVGERYSKLTQFLCHSMGNKSHQQSSSKLMGEEIGLVKMGLSKSKINALRRLADMSINTNKPLCVIGAGETVVKVTGTGIGGRCQELALKFALDIDESFTQEPLLRKSFRVEFLSAGTDGQDGPCDKAGAVVNDKTIEQATGQGLDAQKYLHNNDTYSFFHALNDGKNHVDMGRTGTNVMDIHILTIYPMLY